MPNNRGARWRLANDEVEADEIRTQWQRLQGYGESFVRACEAGRFDPQRDR